MSPGGQFPLSRDTVIGAVAKALRREVDRAAADEWTEAAWGAGSYDELLWLALAWVEVE